MTESGGQCRSRAGLGRMAVKPGGARARAFSGKLIARTADVPESAVGYRFRRPDWRERTRGCTFCMPPMVLPERTRRPIC
jgi:hypothetical protein